MMGIDKDMKEKRERNRLMLKWRKQGKTIKEIAEFFGVSYYACRDIIKRVGGELEGRDFIRELIREHFNHTCQNQKCGRIWKKGKRRFDIHHFGGGHWESREYTGDIITDVYEGRISLFCHKCHLNLPEHRETMSKAKSGIIISNEAITS